MGVSTLQPGMFRLDHLLDTVDNALYRAKQEGRNRISN
jgi:PleD family two-component response regulator